MSGSHQIWHSQHHAYNLSIDCVGFVCRIFPSFHPFRVLWIIKGSTYFRQMECLIHQEVSSRRHALYWCIHAMPCTRGLQPWCRDFVIYRSKDALKTHSTSPSSIKTVPITIKGLIFPESSRISSKSSKRSFRSVENIPFWYVNRPIFSNLNRERQMSRILKRCGGK